MAKKSSNNTLVKSAFKAFVGISFHVNEGETVEITRDRIKYVILDCQYENNNTPVIWLGLSCTKKLYNAIVGNEKNAKFNLNVKIYNAKSGNSLKHNTNIEGEFTYVVSTNNPNFFEDLAVDKLGSNHYIQLVVAMVRMDDMNVLRNPVNKVLETDTSTYLHTVLNGMKYCMSELDNNEEMETAIFSPKSTIVASINELIEKNPFYNSKTKLFADFDKLYLLKTDGEYTEAQDGDAHGFIFKIAKVTTSSSYNEGWRMEGDAYVVDVNPGMVNIIDNSSQDRVCNNLVAIDQLAKPGESIKSIDLEVKTDEDAEKRTGYVYTQSPELYKNTAESNTATLEIVKDDIDMSLITPNKTYKINISQDMGSEYSKYDDSYTLVYKKVVLRNFKGDFTMSTNIGLRKIGNIVPLGGGDGKNQSASKKLVKSKDEKTNKPGNSTTVAGKTSTKPKRLFYQPNFGKPKKERNILPPVKHLKGVSLQRDFTKFSDYMNEKNQ